MSNNRIVPQLAVALALAVATGLIFSVVASTSAQTPPYTAYGIGQKAGAKIGAHIAGKSCGAGPTVDASGNWTLRVALTDACAPREGDTVTFTIDGVPAEQTVVWTAGGAPANAATGIALTAAASGFSGGSIAASGVSIVALRVRRPS